MLLRTEAWLHGRPLLILEMDEVAFDENLSADTFTPVPPTGVAFETLPRSRSLLLEELPAAVAFTVLVPERALDDADVGVMIEAPSRYGVPEHADITYHTFNRDETPTSMTIRESGRRCPYLTRPSGEEVERTDHREFSKPCSLGPISRIRPRAMSFRDLTRPIIR